MVCFHHPLFLLPVSIRDDISLFHHPHALSVSLQTITETHQSLRLTASLQLIRPRLCSMLVQTPWKSTTTAN